MQSIRRAVIDVGTNSVKLLLAELDDHVIRPVLEQSEQTRLGHGFFETHRLQPAAIAQTAKAVASFAALARESEARTVRVIGTSAARDALNQEELRSALQEASGCVLEIISGDQEAEWVFRGVATDSKLQGQSLLILDVGGGSTEFILGQAGHHSFRKSFPLGSLRLLEKFPPRDPPGADELPRCQGWLRQFFKDHVMPALGPSFSQMANIKTSLVGTGGTATILARMEGKMPEYERDRIEGMRFRRAQVADWMAKLWSFPLAERKQLVGLPPRRADVILMGVAIYDTVMEEMQFDEFCVSTRGLRFGALLDQHS